MEKTHFLARCKVLNGLGVMLVVAIWMKIEPNLCWIYCVNVYLMGIYSWSTTKSYDYALQYTVCDVIDLEIEHCKQNRTLPYILPTYAQGDFDLSFDKLNVPLQRVHWHWWLALVLTFNGLKPDLKQWTNLEQNPWNQLWKQRTLHYSKSRDQISIL